MSWVMLEKHFNGRGQVPEEFHNKMERVYAGTYYWGTQGSIHHIHKQVTSFPLKEAPEELLDPMTTWAMPYENVSTDQQRVDWFIDVSSKLNKQHHIWKTTTLTEESRNISAQQTELHIVFPVFGFLPTLAWWLMVCPCGQADGQWKTR